jgi:hypothetical protein
LNIFTSKTTIVNRFAAWQLLFLAVAYLNTFTSKATIVNRVAAWQLLFLAVAYLKRPHMAVHQLCTKVSAPVRSMKQKRRDLPPIALSLRIPTLHWVTHERLFSFHHPAKWRRHNFVSQGTGFDTRPIHALRNVTPCRSMSVCRHFRRQ